MCKGVKTRLGFKWEASKALTHVEGNLRLRLGDDPFPKVGKGRR